MEDRLKLAISPQPDDTTCGPTCLHAVYDYFGDELPLRQVIQEVNALEEGGTLAVLLGSHALRRGYRATLFTFNLQVFDPTWFGPEGPPLVERLQAQMAAKDSPKLQVASRAYLEFLELGGRVKMQDLTGSLIGRYLKRRVPILTGLSATYLYGEAREYGPNSVPDDIRGLPCGHFVVLCGYDRHRRTVLVADPLESNPMSDERYYVVDMDRVRCAILLGIVTYDANLLMIEPVEKGRGSADSHRDQ